MNWTEHVWLNHPATAEQSCAECDRVERARRDDLLMRNHAILGDMAEFAEYRAKYADTKKKFPTLYPQMYPQRVSPEVEREFQKPDPDPDLTEWRRRHIG